MALVLVAAGGTGGHLFPAEALAMVLAQRGITVDLATDERAEHYSGQFPARSIHIVPSATVRGRDPLSLARTAFSLTRGLAKAWSVVGRVKPAAVVGFGGYPTVPPVFAASLRGVPSIVHEQNGVLGRANKLLAPRASAIATSFAQVRGIDGSLKDKATFTGNPVRQQVIVAALAHFTQPAANGPFNLLVFGGSQGAQVMSQIVPAAIELLEPALRARLRVVQQARREDLGAVRAIYDKLGVDAETGGFFPDLPARMAAAHLIVSRSGASTVAELAAIGRPSILVPLPNALDQDQLANASVLEEAGGAIHIDQADFTPDRVAGEIRALAADPGRLTVMAEAAKSNGTINAAERLADLVIKTAKL